MNSLGAVNEAASWPAGRRRWKRGQEARCGVGGAGMPCPMVEALEGRMLLAADLTLRVALAGRTVEPGGTLRAKLTLRNNGNSAAGAFDTTLALSTDKVFGNADDIPLITLALPGGLAAGAKRVAGSVSLTVPAGAPRGKFFLVGKVDSGNAVTESNKTNNTFVSSGRAVRVGPASSTVATVTITALSNGNAVTGSPAQFQVQRVGGSTAAPLTVFFTVAGTAVSGRDFLPLPGAVTIPSGERSATILVSPVFPVTATVPTTVTLILAPGPGYTLPAGGQTFATVALLNSTNLGVVAVPGTAATTAFLTPLVSPLFGTSTFVPLSQSVVFPVGTPFVTLPLGRLVAPLAPPTAFNTLGNALLLSPFGVPPFSTIPLTPVIPPIESPISFPTAINPFAAALNPVPFGTLPTFPGIPVVVENGGLQTLTTPFTVPAGTFFEAAPIGTFVSV